MSVPVNFEPFRFQEVGQVSTPEPTPEGSASSDIGVSFAERLREFTDGVNETQQEAEQMTRDFAEGRQNDIHGTMVQMQQADIEFRMLGTVRNKVIEAYREVMKMGS